jgi:hypothetical protein
MIGFSTSCNAITHSSFSWYFVLGLMVITRASYSDKLFGLFKSKLYSVYHRFSLLLCFRCSSVGVAASCTSDTRQPLLRSAYALPRRSMDWKWYVDWKWNVRREILCLVQTVFTCWLSYSKVVIDASFRISLFIHDKAWFVEQFWKAWIHPYNIISVILCY